MIITINAKFTPEIIEILEKAKIPQGAEITIIFEDKKAQSSVVKGKWAIVAREMSEENLLAGMEVDFFQWSREFRESFDFKALFFSKNKNE
ncbi:hypothetical protein MBAV_002473 [Candidatus Magnetobacterium bavaricum]|uniref:Uncharacterized protein n=1 Tax=Candidatus Magnetobacterium bavaricum TaxID=29290 RepID=A0A0F3GU16_9BACT|nr:hypothetical protein MBAV_002473 [Candidatus Magnetobacterium bavaricum]